MASIMISNQEETLKAEISPDHGGMIAQLYLNGQELLHLDRGQLETAPMAAGGMPILFPFASKTANDGYVWQGKKYGMPMHGLVKNDVFVLEKAEKDRAVLWLENSPSWKFSYYPFDFHLELEYRLKAQELEVIVRVTNQSGEAMPHYLGFHPFFLSTDKKRTSLVQDMQIHYDYEKYVDRPMCPLDDLSQRWDDVFHTPKKGGFIFSNQADGYQVECRTDANFDALVVCSWVPESMCIEPWCGLPNSINTKHFLKWVDPGKTETYGIRFSFEKL